MTQTAAATAKGQQSRTAAAAAAALNSVAMAGDIDTLTNILDSGQNLNFSEFSSHCLSLSRGIDYAVANNELPDSANKIPGLMKQLCARKDTFAIQAFTMIVLVFVKNASKVGWFSEEEKQEMFALSNEIENKFCSHRDANTVSNSHSVIATVMERFYPCIKMGCVLTTFDIKSGYGVYVHDFHILRKMACSLEDTIRLLVVQVDNLDTSACILSPQQVSFIINGKGVERTNVFMDSVPQMPTHVTPLLKYGTNLLQAVGDFKGNYLVVVAFMCEMPLPDPPVLLDHVQSHVDGSESDPDLIEGPSRISLNCPISLSRIKLPVKGHSCKHLQCFDFKNFVKMNFRRPSWRCPHCNQYVCYTDIRVDQNIAKVLKEVGENVSNVIISADGSWKAVFENDDNDQFCDISRTSLTQESADTPNSVPIVVDLTHDGAMDIDENNHTFEIEDTKPSVADLLAPLDSNDTISVDQTLAAPIDDEFFVGLNVPSGLGPTSWSEQSPTMVAPGPSGLVNFLASPLQFINPANSNEYGSVPSMTRSAVNRIPIAVQALRAQTLGSQTTRPIVNSSTRNPSPSIAVSQAGLSNSPTANGFDTICSDLERQQLFTRALISQPQTSNPVVSSPTSLQHHHFVTPTHNHQARPFTSQMANTTPYRIASLTDFQNPHLQQAFNPRLPHQFSHSPLFLTPVPQHYQAGPAQTQQHYPSPAGVFPGGPGPTQVAEDSTPEQNWRPVGRMRGSLSGRDYSHFVDQIIQPTQPPRPPQMTIMPQMQVLLANHLTAHASRPRNDGAQ